MVSPTVRVLLMPQVRGHLNFAGFDGRVFVTDLLRIMTALQTQSKSTENILYPCDNVVGSVHWVPSGNYLYAACAVPPIDC